MVYNGEVLRIPAARRTDEGEYICTVTNSAGTDSASAFLYVKGKTKNRYFQKLVNIKMEITLMEENYTKHIIYTHQIIIKKFNI